MAYTYISTSSHGYLKLTFNQFLKVYKEGFRPSFYSYISNTKEHYVLLEHDYDMEDYLKFTGELGHADIREIYRDINNRKYTNFSTTYFDQLVQQKKDEKIKSKRNEPLLHLRLSYINWLKSQGLNPEISADDYLYNEIHYNSLTDTQKNYLRQFIMLWEMTEKTTG